MKAAPFSHAMCVYVACANSVKTANRVNVNNAAVVAVLTLSRYELEDYMDFSACLDPRAAKLNFSPIALIALPH